MIKSLRKEVEEIRRNPPSAILLPLPVPTSINPQTLGRRNVSETSSLTLNSPTTAFLTKLTKHLFNFFAYSSKKSKLCFFLTNFKTS